MEENNNQPEEKERCQEECRAQWGRAIEDNRLAKSQQWQTAFYGFLLQAALMNFIYLITKGNGIVLGSNGKWLLSLVSGVILVITIALLALYQNAMKGHRRVMMKMEESFTLEFRELTKEFYPLHKEDYLKFWYGYWIFVVMISAQLVCFGFVIYYNHIIK